jgi:hypothetical protein
VLSHAQVVHWEQHNLSLVNPSVLPVTPDHILHQQDNPLVCSVQLVHIKIKLNKQHASHACQVQHNHKLENQHAHSVYQVFINHNLDKPFVHCALKALRPLMLESHSAHHVHLVYSRMYKVRQCAANAKSVPTRPPHVCPPVYNARQVHTKTSLDRQHVLVVLLVQLNHHKDRPHVCYVQLDSLLSIQDRLHARPVQLVQLIH